jgi:predicted YcjX-like family ATPase
VFEFLEQIRLAGRAFAEFSSHLFDPTIRLGITGLSRAGKTVFITALINALTRGGRFPVFEALDSGRIARARLAPQPDDGVPRFDVEGNIAALSQRNWPESTRQISELRLVIDYQSKNGAQRTLTLDLVDYPGEWLLDLPLLEKSYETWSAESVTMLRQAPGTAGTAWSAFLSSLDPSAAENEQTAIEAARLFTAYLQSRRETNEGMSLAPPGRFLMPGDLAGTPALTFAPLDLAPHAAPPAAGSLHAMMIRRYEAYQDIVVRPFFRDHFARLDRQIVLVDAMAAINAGPRAVHELQQALGAVLDCFHVGRNTLWGALFRPRIGRILLAATKADHLHQTSHDRLEHILRHLAAPAVAKADLAGALVDVAALAAVRATREATVERGGERLACVAGTPLAGEVFDGHIFDGATEVAFFPGDLPSNPDDLFRPSSVAAGGGRHDPDLRFLKVRPPAPSLTAEGVAILPHIRLDRALQFLIGDRLQ